MSTLHRYSSRENCRERVLILLEQAYSVQGTQWLMHGGRSQKGNRVSFLRKLNSDRKVSHTERESRMYFQPCVPSWENMSAGNHLPP